MDTDGQRLERRSVARPHQAGPATFFTKVYDDGASLVVTPTGDLDMATVPAVAAVARRCTDGHRALVVDLSHASFMDSRMIQLLLELRDGPWGDRLVVVPPPGEVGQVLDHTGVRSLFRWASSPAGQSQLL